MYCEKCGSKLKDGVRFCDSCGSPVPEEEDVSGIAGQDSLPKDMEGTGKKDSDGGKKPVIIAAAVAVVLIAAGLLFGAMRSRKPEEKEIPRAAAPAETEEEAEAPEESPAEPAEAQKVEPAVRDYYVDYVEAYEEIVRQAAFSEKGASGWSLYDMDGDGMPELFVMEGVLLADFRCVAYTYDIETGAACFLGEVLSSSGVLYEPENREAGIIAVEEHMGVERVSSVKKAGKDRLNITEISFSENVQREYYSTPYPVYMFDIDELDRFAAIETGNDGITGLKTPEGRDVCLITCKAYATSVLQEPDRKHSTANLFDINPATVWVEGAAGTGEGEAIVFNMRDSDPADGIAILPGYCRDQTVYEKNGRPVKITVKCGSMIISESLENFKPDFTNIGNSIIYIEFDKPVFADTITVVISGAVGGTQYEDTCIAELFPYQCIDLSEYDN